MVNGIKEGIGKMGLKSHCEEEERGDPLLVGFAFIDSWNIDLDAHADLDNMLLSVIKEKNRRRRHATVMQHRVHLAMHLLRPIPVAESPLSNEALSNLWNQCLSLAMRVTRRGETRIVFEAGRDASIGKFSYHHGTLCHWWPTSYLIGHALCLGLLTSDFSVSVSRRSSADHWIPPHLPDRLSRLPATPHADSSHLERCRNVCFPFTEAQRACGFVSRFSVEAKIWDTAVSAPFRTRAQDMDAHLGNVDHLKSALRACHEESQESSTVTDQPTGDANPMCMKPTLRMSNFLRLDIAAMMAQREVYAKEGPYFRFLATDKGPQCKGSWEILNTVEIIVPRKSVWGRSLLEIDNIERRKLPPCCMAQGGVDVANTCLSLLHQCWLEYGPSPELLRSSNADVIGLGTDLGCESGVGDHHCVVDYFIEAELAADGGGPAGHLHPPHSDTFLFPSAMKVAGPLHCIDWMIRASLNKLTGFPLYLKTAKVLLQYMHSKTHRSFMQRRMRISGLPADVQAECNEALEHGCGRFADWRWESIFQCHTDLQRYKLSIVSLCDADNLPAFNLSRNAQAASAFKSVTESDFFWNVNDLIGTLLEPLQRLHGWIKGCPCHPVNSQADKRPANCPFQGLNCKGFSDKLGETVSLYEELRNFGALNPNGDNGIDIPEVHDIIGFIISMLYFKLIDWVDDLPYLIWQVPFFIRDPNIGYIKEKVSDLMFLYSFSAIMCSPLNWSCKFILITFCFDLIMQFLGIVVF